MLRSTTHHRTPLLLVGLSAGLLAGCGHSARIETGSDVTEEVSPSTTALELGAGVNAAGAPTLDSYFQAIGATQVAISARRSQLLAECMNTAGFHFEPPAVPSDPSAADPFAWQYGPGTEAEALRGYHRAQGDPVIEHPQQDASPAFESALWGDESGSRVVFLSAVTGKELGNMSIPGGCQHVALESIFGTIDRYVKFETDLQQLNEFDNLGRQTLIHSTEFEGLNSEWAACMNAAGHGSFASPIAAAAADWGENATDVELATAAADVSCKSQVSYVTRADALLTSIDNQLLLGHEALVAEFGEIFSQIVIE